MDRLFRPAHIASLAFFRICFGFLLIYEVTRYFKYGWIKRNYIDPDYHFSYFGWDWIQPFGGNGMYCLFFVLGFLAFCISIGFLYRISTILFFVGFTYIFLLDKTYYLNHFYLISLISFLLIVIPTHRQYSVDAKLFPSLRTDTLPNWMLYLLTFQIAIPYVYGGIAKINRDWIRGEPMFTWFQSYVADGHLPSIFASSSTALLFSYGGLLFDLLIVPALLWRKTRLVAYIIALCFHLMNAFIFNIGVFPWFMIVATTLFFKPEWCKSLLNRIKSKRIGNKVNHKSNRVVIALVALFIV